MVANCVLALFSLQGLLMFLDEGIYHRRRRPGAWERWSHSFDSLIYLIVLSLPAFLAPEPQRVKLYAVSALLSCLVITKDEWIHVRECKSGEHWLHSVLFMIHPAVLIGVGYLWVHGTAPVLREALPFFVLPLVLYQIARGVSFARPKPIAHSRKPALVRPKQINNRFYEELGERWYEDDRHPIALLRAETGARLAYIERVLRAMKLERAKILDLGCGGGLIAIPLARKEYDVRGIDLSESSLAVARKRVSEKGNASFARGDVYSLREPSSSYDVVLMMDLLEHLEEPEVAIHEAARILKPGGLLIFHTFNRNLLSYLLAVKGIGVLCAGSPPDIHVYRLFIKPAELSRMCARAGLRIRERIGIRPRLLTTAFWRTLLTRRVDPSFEFTLTRSVPAGYLGYAVKSAPP